MSIETMTVQLEGIVPDKPNVNGWIYPKKTIAAALEKAIAPGTGIPAYLNRQVLQDRPDYSKIAGVIRSYLIYDTHVNVHIDVVDNEAGRTMKTLLSCGFGITAHGVATIDYKVIQPDYRIDYCALTDKRS